MRRSAPGREILGAPGAGLAQTYLSSCARALWGQDGPRLVVGLGGKGDFLATAQFRESLRFLAGCETGLWCE